MRVVAFVIFLLLFPVAFIAAYQQGWLDKYIPEDAIPADPFIKAELATKTDAADLAVRINTALDNGDYDDALMYADIAQYMVVKLDPETQARLDAEKTMTRSVVRNTGGFFEGFVTGQGNSTAAFMGAITSDFTVVGDVRDIGSEGSKMVIGEDYSKLILGLSVVGLAATTATVATGGGGLPARVGVSLLKVAEKAGTITVRFARNITRLLGEAVNFERLRGTLRTVDLSNTSATRRAVTSYADTISFAKLAPVVDNMAALNKSIGPAESVRVLKYVDNTDDLARVAKMGGKMGAKTRGIIELTGKTSLRAFKTVTNLVRLALEWIWAIVAGIGTILFGSATRAVTRRSRTA